MTREEAIEVIKEYRDNLIISPSNQLDGDVKAFDMAIQALTQEPCDDAVSIRKDILKCRVGNIVAYNVEWLKKHWQMEMDIVCGVKPCTDAVSRQVVLKIIDGWYEQNRDTENIEDLIVLITYMDSVTQKSGKWDRLYNWLNDMRLGIAPDETVTDIDERHCRESQTDILDEIMEWMIKAEVEPQESEE